MTETAKVVSQVVGRAWDQCINLCTEVLYAGVGWEAAPDRGGLAWGCVLGRAGVLVLSCSQQQIVCGLPGRTHGARMGISWLWESGDAEAWRQERRD